MKRIYYAGRDFLTGDRIADAVLSYATALARRTRADWVGLPAMLDGGSGRVEVVLGPSSQLLVESVEDPRDDPTDDELVEELNRRAEVLRGPHSVVVRRGGWLAEGDDLADEF